MNGDSPKTAIWLSDQGNVGRGGAPVEEVAMPRENPAQQQVETPDDGQIDRLNARYRGPLTSYFLRRVRRRDEAEDLTQEVFLRMVRSLQRTDGDGGERIDNPEAFLFRTAVNLLRDRARRARTFAEHLAEAAHRDENIEVRSPERVLQGRQSLRSALTALEELDARTRDVFILHRLEGLKHAEIATLYGVSSSSIEKYMIKALAHLARRARAF
jgi:RNA polymerase sigma-70 factor (ECF subfamily)